MLRQGPIDALKRVTSVTLIWRSMPLTYAEAI